MTRNRHRVGIVLAGAGARGAYEAGALRKLLPALVERGEAPTTFVGTSAGAINAAFLASRADAIADAPKDVADELVGLWRGLDRRKVMWPFISTLLTVPAYAAGTLVPGLARSALNVGKLRGTLDEAMGDWGTIDENVKSGACRALGITATAVGDGSTVIFTASKDTTPKPDLVKGIRYEPATIGVDHVLASAAIPILFPPINIERNGSDHWYVDGGTRLNTPIKPALEFGVDRVVVVATDPAKRWEFAPRASAEARGPDFDDAMLHLVQAAIADPLIEDLHRLAQINVLLASASARGKRQCGYMFVGPARQGTFGRIAHGVMATPNDVAYSELEYAVLNRLLGLQGNQGAELLSFVLFERDFLDRCIAEGEASADAELARVAAMPGGWRYKPIA